MPILRNRSLWTALAFGGCGLGLMLVIYDGLSSGSLLLLGAGAGAVAMRETSRPFAMQHHRRTITAALSALVLWAMAGLDLLGSLHLVPVLASAATLALCLWSLRRMLPGARRGR